jgi:hypothetical protein
MIYLQRVIQNVPVDAPAMEQENVIPPVKQGILLHLLETVFVSTFLCSL